MQGLGGAPFILLTSNLGPVLKFLFYFTETRSHVKLTMRLSTGSLGLWLPLPSPLSVVITTCVPRLDAFQSLNQQLREINQLDTLPLNIYWFLVREIR